MLRRTYLREEDATFATVCNAFVPKQVRVGTGVGSQSGDALSNLPFLALILILWRLRWRSLRCDITTAGGLEDLRVTRIVHRRCLCRVLR